MVSGVARRDLAVGRRPASSQRHPSHSLRAASSATGADGARVSSLADLPLVLSAEETADVLRVSKWQIYEAVKRGEIRAVRLGRCLRIPREEIARLLGGPPDAA